MKVDITIPSVGESVTEAIIGDWLKNSGQFVKRDEVLLLLETDKASVEVVAPADGVLHVLAEKGSTQKIGSKVAEIDTEAKAAAAESASSAAATPPAAPAVTSAPAAPVSASAPASATPSANLNGLSPAVRRVISETGVDPQSITGSGKGGRLTKSDVELAAANLSASGSIGPLASIATATPSALPSSGGPSAVVTSSPRSAAAVAASDGDMVVRRPMSTIRKRIAERLVSAQHTAAILTTFNEIDMSAVISLRARYKDLFKDKYGVSLGFMGFFVKATIRALREVPMINNSIDGTDILEKNFHHIGVAVGTEKGLVVPVIRHADQLTLPEIEGSIQGFAKKARDGKLTVDDLSGGTFTISNGGVYGSLMSTPILNPPQSGILGMHKIEDRAVVVNQQIVIRPMMYVALSYDHRIVDGKEAVTFLVKVKENIEDPTRLLLEV